MGWSIFTNHNNELAKQSRLIVSQGTSGLDSGKLISSLSLFLNNICLLFILPAVYSIILLKSAGLISVKRV